MVSGSRPTYKGAQAIQTREYGYDGVVKDPADPNEVTQKKVQAIARSFEWGDKIPIGLFYRIEEPTFEDMISIRMPSYKEVPLTKQDLYNRDVKQPLPRTELKSLLCFSLFLTVNSRRRHKAPDPKFPLTAPVKEGPSPKPPVAERHSS